MRSPDPRRPCRRGRTPQSPLPGTGARTWRSPVEDWTLAGVASNVEIYFEEDERRVLPHISLGLFAAVMRMVREHDVTHCYAVMEPALLRLVGRFGVIFNRIGADVDYHGLRVPCLAIVDEALPQIHAVAPSVWDLITNRGELFRQRA